MFSALRSLVLLRRIDRGIIRLALAAERIATVLERGDREETGLTMRFNETDPTGEAGVYPPNDAVLSEILDREGKLGRMLTEAEVADLFTSGPEEQ